MAVAVTTESSERASAVAPRSARRRRGLVKAGFLTPALLWIGIIIVAPNIFLVAYSLLTNSLGAVQPPVTLENYGQLLSSAVFSNLFWRTLSTALLSALIATCVAYFAAYVVVRHFGKYKALAALLILIPLWVSYLMRVFAWRIILGETGVLATVSQWLGFGQSFANAFLYSQNAVVLTLGYVAVPYAFLSVYAALDRIPQYLWEASSDCGATTWTTFRRVIWPLSRPGTVVGFGIGFTLAFGDYISPSMVGGLEGTMLGTMVLQQFGTANNWALGSAVGVSIVLTGLVVLAGLSLFTRVEAPIE